MNSGTLASIAWTFAKKYRTTLLAWLVILAFGLLSYSTYLNREGFPTIQLPIAIIQGEYAVGDSEQVDSDVVQPLAGELSELESIDSFNATSFNDRYSVFVSFTEATEIDDGVDELDQLVNQQLSIPDDATIAIQSIDPSKFNNSYDLIFAVYDQANNSYEELQALADDVAKAVSVIDEVQGAETNNILQEIQIPNSDQTTTLQNGVNFIGVRTAGNVEFYPAINVGVVAKDNTDALELSKAVSDILSDYESSNTDTKTVVSADFASTINDQIDSLESNLLTGLIAVIAVGWVLISWRAAVVIALFIPTVLAASFIGLNLGGQTLNTITLFSTILTLGLFVDDATIVVEAIDASRKRKEAKQAIKSAVKRVGTASLAGTLTTILVFTPMLMVSGILGEFIQLLPITVIIALVVSFTVSMTLAPFLSRLFVLPKTNNRAIRLLDKLSLSLLISKISLFLGRVLHKTKSKSKSSKAIATVAILISFTAIAGGGYLAYTLPLSIFPETKDANQLTATIDASTATTDSLEASAKSINSQISDTLGDELEQLSYISGAQGQLSIQINLSDYHQRGVTSQQLLEQLNNDVETDEVEVSFGQIDAGPPAEEFPFQMRVSAQQPQLDIATNQIASFIEDNSVDVGSETVKIVAVETDADLGIRRSEDGQFRTISAQFDTEELTSGSVAALENKINGEFDSQRLGALGLSDDALNFNVSLESQNAESFESIQLGLLGAVAAMYLLLVLLFNSLSQPLLILLAVPFSIFGVFGGLHLTDNPLSFFVMVGFLGLIGIVVNNTILLVEYANQLRQDAGADRWDAISAAVAQRFRPLITTTTTTVVALLPLAWSDPFWQPLAYTLIFGLISSTTLIIISFPYYYLGLERIRDWKNKRFPQLH